MAPRAPRSPHRATATPDRPPPPLPIEHRPPHARRPRPSPREYATWRESTRVVALCNPVHHLSLGAASSMMLPACGATVRMRAVAMARMTYADYVAFEAASDVKHEYVNGEV